MKTGKIIGQYIILILSLLLLNNCSKPKVYKVGILVGVEENIPVAESFINSMEEFGYIQGENITYDIQDGKSDTKIMKQICTAFVNKNVDLILTITHGATQIAKDITAGTSIPVVFSYAVTNRGGLVKSIAEPGGNITGVRYPIPDMAIKRFEFLIDINPNIKNVLLPHKRDYPPALIVIDGLNQIAQEKNVELIKAPFDSLDEMEEYFSSLEDKETNIDSIIVLPEPFVYSDRGWSLIKGYSYNNKIPIAANSFHMSREGALFSYTNKDREMGELAAPLVNKIFNGEQAGKIPIVTPKIHLHINMNIAKEFGLIIPDSMKKLAVEITNEE